LAEPEMQPTDNNSVMLTTKQYGFLFLTTFDLHLRLSLFFIHNWYLLPSKQNFVITKCRSKEMQNRQNNGLPQEENQELETPW